MQTMMADPSEVLSDNFEFPRCALKESIFHSCGHGRRTRVRMMPLEKVKLRNLQDHVPLRQEAP